MQQQNRFDGETVLVSGGARGIGEAAIRAFHAEGARVIVADLLDEEGEALAAELGERARFQRLDVTSEQSWADAVGAAEAANTPISILINNAGVGSEGTVLDHTTADFERVFAVNAKGTFLGMRAVVPGMVERGSGAVVNVSSIAGMFGWPNGLAYSASKWAIRGLTLSAALDLTGTGVRVNLVSPGIIATPMTAGGDYSDVLGGQPVPRLGEPDEVVAVMTFLASAEASFCSGEQFAVDGGYSAGMARA